MAEVLSSLIDESMGEQVGVSFIQQERQISGVPDGIIEQQSISIFLETKRGEDFDRDQLERHLYSLKNRNAAMKVLIALGNIERDDTDIIEKVRSKYPDVLVVLVSFEDFLDALSLPTHLPKQLSDMVLELRTFFDEEGLLPSWKYLLDVVNCARMPEDVENGFYMCPATGGAYSHKRCRFFGMYGNKVVSKIAEIRAVIDVRTNFDNKNNNYTEILWNNEPVSEEKILIEDATKKVQIKKPNYNPARVFLLGPSHETMFEKETPGGMLGSKQYFNISTCGETNAKELAKKLNGKKWSEFPRR